MKSIGKHVFVAAALTMATQPLAQHITFFGREARIRATPSFGVIGLEGPIASVRLAGRAG